MSHRLFVYGTLLPGQPNAVHLAGARRLGPAATTARFHLLDCSHLPGYGCFPALRPGGDTSVKGELYLVDPRQLAALDLFEGHPDLFTRVAVGLAGGGQAEAYMLLDAHFVGAIVIPGGDWRAHRARQTAQRLAGSRGGP
jgi:gamma-glutamylaminecyclotransferase